MFRILFFEFLKLIKNKTIIVSLISFLLINFGISYYTCYIHTQRNLPDSVMKEFYALYKEDKETIEEDYRLRQETLNNIKAYIQEEAEKGNKNVQVTFPADKYISHDIWDDGDLYNELYGRIQYIQDYRNVIDKAIENAENNILYLQKNLGDKDSYAIEYQKETIEKYSQMPDKVLLRLEYIKGWDAFFSYSYDDIIIFVIIAVISSYIFGIEYSSGFNTILRISQKGRLHTTAAKIFVLFFASSLVVLLLTFETWLVYYFKVGFSSPFNNIQIFSEYIYCPYDITVLEYFFIKLLFGILTYTVFALITASLSILIRNNIVSFVASLFLIILNYISSNLQFLNPTALTGNINMYSMVNSNSTFTHYRLMNVFGYALDQNIGKIIIYGLLLIAVVILIIFQQNKPYTKRIINWKKLPFTLKNVPTIKRKNKKYPMNLFYWETFKNLIQPRNICIILLLTVKILSSSESYVPTVSFVDAVYKDYMTHLSGPLTEEKENYISSERKFIDDSLNRHDEMSSNFKNEIISYEEYMDYLEDYNYAYGRTDILLTIENHLNYIKKLENHEMDAWFVYDTDWKKVILPEFDWTLFIFQLIYLTSVFSIEYEGRVSGHGFYQILRTTVNGRKRTFRWKVISALIGCCIICLTWFSIDLIFISNNLNLPCVHAPVQSIQLFSSYPNAMTIHEYTAMTYIIRFAIYLSFSISIVALSAIFRNNILVILCAVVFTIIPSMFYDMGLSWCGILNYKNAYQVTSMILDNRNYLWIYISILIILNLVLLSKSRNLWKESRF